MNTLLNEAISQWLSLSSFRKERIRNKNFTFGRQWCDIIEHEGRQISEHDYIISQGSIPLKNNLIRRIVRNVLGVFRRQLAEKMEGWDKSLQETAGMNRLYELMSRIMEEYLISGMAVCRIHRGTGLRCPLVDPVSPENFFFNNSSRDIRGWDVSLAGQIHDIGINEFCDAFPVSADDFERIRDIFRNGNSLRVYEIWRHERVTRRLIHDSDSGRVIKTDENIWKGNRQLHRFPSRRILDDVWRYYFLTSSGEILAEGDSPYGEKGHPYIFKCYPYLDGEIQSFVADMIDQQKYTNRLITMYDWVMRSSAKGVLLLPEGAVEPEEMENVADQWSRFNGVIVYNPKAGIPEPHQITGNCGNLGIGELLNIQLNMLEDVSGVNGALRGNLSGNSVSGTLYTQQTENALTSLSDILDTFSSFIDETVALLRS